MKGSKGLFLFLTGLAVVLIGTVPLFASGTSEGTASTAAPTLVLMHDKGGNPNYQPFFEAMGKYTKEKIGVGFTATPYPTTDVYQAAVRAALPTKHAPDLFTWWSTYRMKDLIDQGLVANTTSLWNKYKADYSPGLREAFTFNGQVYGFSDVVEYWGVWYNKDVFAKYNLKVPTTWAEFLKVCDTLKANGVVPLGQTVKATWPTFIMFEQLVAGESPQLYNDLNSGKAKYTDPRVRQAFSVWADMINKGYFTDPSTDLFSDMPRLFDQGKVAMILCGTWYLSTLLQAGVPADKLGLFAMPAQNPQAGKFAFLEASPILIAKNSPHLADAMKVADFWMSPDGNAYLAKQLNGFPANSKSDASYLPAVKVNYKNMLINDHYQILNRYWEAAPTPICEQAVNEFAKFILNPSSVAGVLSDLDKIAAAYWAKNPPPAS